jgi:uncharacterized iron-regulated membrane protein
MIRKVFFWIHLVAGIGAAVPLVAMAVTGILLAFEHQIVAFDQRGSVRVAPSPGSRLSLDTLAWRALGPDASKATMVAVQADPLRTIEFRRGKDGAVRVDPMTGNVVWRSGALQSGFALVERLHRWLGSRETGGKVTGVAVLLCLVLSVSGLVLWWPRKVAALRHVLWPRRGLRGKARDWQWHNAVGVLALPCFAVLSLTGTVMAWPWAEAALYAVAGSEAPRREARMASPGSRPAGPERAGDAARKPTGRTGAETGVSDKKWQDWLDSALIHAPEGWSTVTLRAPDKPGRGAQAMFRLDIPHASSGGTVSLRADGSFESWKPARTDAGTKLRFLVKPLHTGELFGLPGQIAMALASLGVLVLVWTGLALGWRRLFRKTAPG